MQKSTARLVERLRPTVTNLAVEFKHLQTEVKHTSGLLAQLAEGSTSGTKGRGNDHLSVHAPPPFPRMAQKTCASGPKNGTSTVRMVPERGGKSGKTVAKAFCSRVAPSPTPLSSMPADSRMVVLNCANIGCAYVKAVRRNGRGTDHLSSCNFDWEGVRRAFQFYEKNGVLPQGVCKNRTAVLSPVPEDLKPRIIVCPVVDDHPDADDLFTIRLAMKYRCQLVDNDNYRDWKSGEHGNIDDEVRNWLIRGEGAKLKVTYVFDCMGLFLPSIDPVPIDSSSEGENTKFDQYRKL